MPFSVEPFYNLDQVDFLCEPCFHYYLLIIAQTLNESLFFENAAPFSRACSYKNLLLIFLGLSQFAMILLLAFYNAIYH